MTAHANQSHPSAGYVYAPKRRSHSPGYPRLEITMLGESSDVRFDPKEVYCSVFTSQEWAHPHAVDHLKIVHPWHGHSSFEVVPGAVIASGRKGRKLEVFTFGGSLQIDSQGTFTLCTVESPVPIIEISLENHPLLTLVEEVEIIFAHRKAFWGRKEEEFDNRLAKVSPDLLYIACLDHIFKQIEHARRDVLDVQAVISLILEERRWLESEGRWPGKVPAIEEIL